MNEGKSLRESLKEVIVNFDQRERVALQEKERAAQKQEKIRLVRRVLCVAGVVFMVFLSARFISNIRQELRLSGKPGTWVMGGVTDDDPGTRECVRNLWAIRIAADSFYVREGRYPATLAELYKAGLLEKPFVCPVSGREYRIIAQGGALRYACPAPERHGLVFLGGDLKSGAPRAEHLREPL